MTAAGETLPSPISAAVATDALHDIIPLTNIAVGSANVIARRVYRRKNGAGSFQLVTGLGDNTTTTMNDNARTSALGGAPPTVNGTIAARFQLSGISVGPGATTARKLYRTTAGGTVLKLLTTLADNTTTTFIDATGDASLGANAPSGDTSQLQQPTGTVLAGSPTLILAGVSAAFSATGGWAIVGNGQVLVRYRGISGNTLTGIPTAGIGSITSSISYGSLATAAPELVGIPASGPGSIQYPIKTGDNINLLVTVDDTGAQAALAAAIGGTGIKEVYIQDGRIGYTEAIARGRATLADRSTVLVEVNYVTRDPLTRSGATIVCELPPPMGLSGKFKIQDVTISNIRPIAGQPPTYTVLASSQRYSLDDLLRIARGTVGA